VTIYETFQWTHSPKNPPLGYHCEKYWKPPQYSHHWQTTHSINTTQQAIIVKSIENRRNTVIIGKLLTASTQHNIILKSANVSTA